MFLIKIIEYFKEHKVKIMVKSFGNAGMVGMAGSASKGTAKKSKKQG